jgi:hypothetical protein
MPLPSNSRYAFPHDERNGEAAGRTIGVLEEVLRDSYRIDRRWTVSTIFPSVSA